MAASEDSAHPQVAQAMAVWAAHSEVIAAAAATLNLDIDFISCLQACPCKPFI